jgi:formate hydrogenlyase transcriptional activator
MNSTKTWFDTINSNKHMLALASLFDIEFSIDWVQMLSKAKATTILMVFEKACQEGLLGKKEIGVFYFKDQKIKEQLKDIIPKGQRERLHKEIATIMINEAGDIEQSIKAAARQLIHVSNDLEGCAILLDAGNRYQKKGSAQNALRCYEKLIDDLKDRKGKQANTLFVKTIIGYSKNRLALGRPDITIPFLKEALKYTEKFKDKSFEAIVLLQLASVEYFRMNYISAQQYFIKGRKIATGIDDPLVQKTLNSFSVLHYAYSGRFKEAIKKYESIESVFLRKTPEYRLSYRVGLILGFCYVTIGQISQGLGLVNQLRDDALLSNDHDAAARTSIYIAWVLIMKKDLESAADLIQKSLKSAKKLDLYTKSLATLLQAYIYFEKNDFKKSHLYLKKALKTRNKYSFTHRGYLFEFCLAMKRGIYPLVTGLSLEDETKMSNYIGNIYSQGVALRYQAIWQQDENQPHEKVFESLDLSLDLLEKSGAMFEIARTKEALGRYYLEQGNIVQATIYTQAAQSTFQKYGDRHVADDLKHLLKDSPPERDSLMKEILNLGPEIIEIQDIKKVAQKILSIVIRITDAERGAIFLYSENSENKAAELLAGKNLAKEDLEKSDFKTSIRLITESARTGQVKLDNIDNKNHDLFVNDSIKSRICVPLLRRGESIGVLYHDNRLFQSTFKKQDLKVLLYFASLAAIALDNAHSYEKIQSLNKRLNETKNYLVEQQLEHIPFEDFVAVSPAIKKVLSLVAKVADTGATVLILGDTGVGKEMVARAIHQQSARCDKPFIRVNCSAFSESLIASELFGHEKNSFTGADKKRIGRFELADTGTLFLDEIGDISMDIQVRLLRVLQTRKFERVGSSESIKSDFRLITATNRNLEKAVAQGKFRQDLFYRLNVFPIWVPPLRERMEGIPSLAQYFLKKHADKMDKSFKQIPEKEINKLLRYHWPGNVRELENVIERGVILSTDGSFTIPELSSETGEASIAGQFTLEEMERRFILNTIQKVNWKIHGPGGAAELLGMNHSTLYSRIKKLGIKNPNKKLRK